MKQRLDSTAEAESRATLLGFEPVPRKCKRHDGWTPERQRGFIGALADTGCVTRAAKMVGMTPEGAYILRRQPQAESFCAAWATALDWGVQRLRDIAFERAIEGVPVPIMYHGKQVGERRHYNDRLLMFTLRHHDPDARAAAGLSGKVSPSTLRKMKAEFEEEMRAKLAAEEEAQREAELAEEVAAIRRIAGMLDRMDARRRTAIEEGDTELANDLEGRLINLYLRLVMIGGPLSGEAARMLRVLGFEPDDGGEWTRAAAP